MTSIMLKNVDLNDKWWIELIKIINYLRNRFSMINKSIISFETNTKRKFFLAHLRRIETSNYVMKRKSITKWKKLVFRSFFVVFVNYEKDHIYRMLRFNEIIYRISFVIWINEKRKKSSTVEISSTKRSVIESAIFSTKRQALKSNLVIILIASSQFNQLIIVVSLFSIFSTARINTLNIESISSISSTLSVLERHFELRYRFDFSNSLNLLIMKCMKNVIDFQQIAKSRSYKKTMNDLNRNEWLKIMKNEINFLLINEIWTLINSFKDRRIFRNK
jgi:hypothetical protein